MNRLLSADSALCDKLKKHPVLLIPLFFAYGILMIAAGFGLAILMVLVYRITPQALEPVSIKLMLSTAFKMSFGFFSAVIWLHYIYLALRAFVSSASIVGSTSNVLKMIQLIAATAFAFSVIHYYIALFSSSPAYEGIRPPAPVGGWSESSDKIDRLCHIPDAETVINFLYFSTVTMATVGYGDIYPVTPLAKLVTIVQIVFAFEMIVVGLGLAMGQRE